MTKRIFKMEIKLEDGKKKTIFFPVAVYSDKEKKAKKSESKEMNTIRRSYLLN